MKQFIYIILIILFNKTLYSQSNESFKYHFFIDEVSYNSLKELNSAKIDILILEESINGNIVYQESHFISLPESRLININVGLIYPDNFLQINWANGPYFIDVYVEDINIQTNQILSVPYAICAKTVQHDNIEDEDASTTNEIQNLSLSNNEVLIEQASGTNLSSISDTPVIISGNENVDVTGTYPHFNIASTNSTPPVQEHYIGELFGGGIIYYIDYEHRYGLIMSLHDLNNGASVEWSSTWWVDGMYNNFDGQLNTTNLVNQAGNGTYAAKLCDDYTITTDQTYSDWYLPSVMEFRLINEAIWEIDSVLRYDNDETTYGFPENAPLNNKDLEYWTSTQRDLAYAYLWDVGGEQNRMGQFVQYVYGKVRAIRKFSF